MGEQDQLSPEELEQMALQELLDNMAGLQLPDPVALWPPAPGWWLLAAALLLLCALLLYRGLQRLHRQRLLRGALAELARAGDINEVNGVLRRVALFHFPRSAVAALSGTAWVDFIRHNGDASLLNDGLAHALGHGRFQRRCEVDGEALYQFAEAWITSLYLHRRSPLGTP